MVAIDSSTVPLPGAVWFTTPEADGTVIGLRGEHDASTVAALADALARAIAFDDADLVLDLSELAFMGAATVGLIVRAREYLRPRSRALTLRAPSASAHRVLEICGLTDLLEPNADAAPSVATAGALGSWVAVPATERADQHVAAPAASESVAVGRLVAPNTSTADADRSRRLATP
jgi:anti-anti-sigma factor